VRLDDTSVILNGDKVYPILAFCNDIGNTLFTLQIPISLLGMGISKFNRFSLFFDQINQLL